MATEPTEEGNAPQTDENLKPSSDAPAEEFVVEDDPMIIEMKAAEAEIAAAGQGDQPGAEEPKDGTETPAGAQAQPKDDKAPGAKGILVPKGRLDEALSERDLLRDQVAYLRGLNDAKTASIAKTEQPPAAAQPAAGDKKPGEQPVVDEIEAAITAAEAKKLDLAGRYDEGEISSKQWKEQEIAIDKEIRELSNKRMDRVREESKNDAQAVVSASQAAEWVNGQALSIQAKHPNVAVIDATPEAIRNGIWQQITAQATQNLTAQGINVKDGSARTRVALIEEKARLTESYTPDALKAFLPQDFKAPVAPQKKVQSQQPGQPAPSDKATNLRAKIELANSQPPPIADMGNGAGTAEITEADIEGMTDDQMADLLAKAPQLVQRIIGSR